MTERSHVEVTSYSHEYCALTVGEVHQGRKPDEPSMNESDSPILHKVPAQVLNYFEPVLLTYVELRNAIP